MEPMTKTGGPWWFNFDPHPGRDLIFLCHGDSRSTFGFRSRDSPLLAQAFLTSTQNLRPPAHPMPVSTLPL